MAGILTNFSQRVNDWAEKHNAFYGGPYADLLSLIPFAFLIVILYLTGREVLFAQKGSPEPKVPPGAEPAQ